MWNRENNGGLLTPKTGLLGDTIKQANIDGNATKHILPQRQSEKSNIIVIILPKPDFAKYL